MSTAKVIFNLADKCSNYVKAFGKSSILQTKPFKGKLTPNSLGVVFSDGSIKFQSEKSAMKYINNRLQVSLNRSTKDQFERVIAKKETTIIGEGNGSHNECNEAFFNIPGMGERFIKEDIPRDLEVFHSHPDVFGKGKTAPLSSPDGGDIGIFFNLKLKKIVAINSNGEFNSLEVGQNFSDKNYKLFANGMGEYVGKKVLGKLYDQMKNLFDKINEYESKNLDIPEELTRKQDVLMGKVSEIERDIQASGKLEKFVHEYYQKANDFGMIYSTNFSNLI